MAEGPRPVVLVEAHGTWRRGCRDIPVGFLNGPGRSVGVAAAGLEGGVEALEELIRVHRIACLAGRDRDWRQNLARHIG